MSTVAAVYVRISKDVRDGEGVERQEELCRELAARRGWEVSKVFSDNDISASTNSRKPRPGYAAMLADAEAGKFAAIVSYSASRLTRRPRELEDLIRLHEVSGVEIATCVSGQFDLATADGRAIARTLAAWDAAEAERTSERILAQQQQRRAKGIQTPRRTFGWGRYETEHGKQVRVLVDGDKVNSPEAEALKVAAAEVLRGRSLAAVARDWNASGPASVSGAAWTSPRVGELLVRWRNAGVVVHKGVPVEGVPGQWEPIFDRELLERLRAFILDPSRRTNGPGRRPAAVMSATALCGKCGDGTKMVGSKVRARDGRERFLYRCSTAVSQNGPRHFMAIERHVLDGIVLTRLAREIALGAGAHLIPSGDVLNGLADLRSKRAGVAEEERELGKAMGAGEMSVLALKEALAGRQRERERLDMEIRRIESGYEFADLARAILPSEVAGLKVSLNAAAAIKARILSLHPDQQRELIRQILKVTVFPGRPPERVVIELADQP